jgi:transketolase
MRDAFTSTLLDLCEDDSEIVLLSGDLGFGVLDEFRVRFPGQFLNLGVAEQNLAGVGAGLALSGHKVLTYSIGNFPTLRCLEQLRNDVCYHDADLIAVTVGGGMAYGALGPSHFATEDLAIMRSLPGMRVVAPGDPVEVEALLPQLIRGGGPAYLRLGRAGEDRLVPSHARVVLGEPTVLFEDGSVLLLSIGGMLSVAFEGRQLLQAKGLECALASVHTLSPFNEQWLMDRAGKFDLIVTVEEHSARGGLGGAVAEVLAGAPRVAPLLRIGLGEGFPSGVGSQEYLRQVNSIDAESVARRVMEKRETDNRTQ